MIWWLLAQAPPDPSAFTGLAAGGATAVALFMFATSMWYFDKTIRENREANATRDKEWRKFLSKQGRSCHIVSRQVTIALMESTKVLAEASHVIEGSFNPSESVVLRSRKMQKEIDDLKRIQAAEIELELTDREDSDDGEKT